ncbi:MAG: dihydroorotate dehydrogenase electron transfer subunit [Lachnospiraceae bacterium]|nr:dihydroorotate dehydrogenase electron transfer subunit [Lachnospiraceae bacterium]
MVYPKDKATLLPRPISICEVRDNMIRLVFRVAGKGTAEFSDLVAGERIRILGPLGNGFPLDKAEGNVVLMGGGIGIPPILELSRKLKAVNPVSILGYRNADTFLSKDFAEYGNVLFASEDGSVGAKGNVMDALKASGIKPDVIMACGPMPMLRAIKAYAAEQGIKAYISLEERMACGVGACLGCVCKTVHKDEHSHVNNARVCTEGPVFSAEEVDI